MNYYCDSFEGFEFYLKIARATTLSDNNSNNSIKQTL